MKLPYLPLALSALFATSLAAHLPKADPAEVGLNPAKLEAAMALYRNAVSRGDAMRGALVVVVKDGRIVAEEAMGYHDHEARKPFTPDSLIHMASNSKAFVAAAVQILVEDGRLRPDDPVGRWIPEFDTPLFKGMTVEQLITHTSGLPRSPIFLPNMRPDTNLRLEAARFAGRLHLQTDPGAAYQYSNAAYNVLGGVIEAASGQDLSAFLHSRIFQPLGMRNTFAHESEVESIRLGPMYRRRDNRWERIEGNAPRYPIARASGGLISTSSDMAVWVQMFLDGGKSGDARILSEESIANILTPRSRTSETDSAPNEGYGYGWRIHADGSFSHGGSDGTFIWASPEHRMFALMLTQSRTGRQQPRRAFYEALQKAVVR